MTKYRTIISTTYDIEADTPEEAEEKAIELFEEDLQKAVSCGDSPAEWMGVSTIPLEEK